MAQPHQPHDATALVDEVRIEAPQKIKLTPEAAELRGVLDERRHKLLIAQTAPSVRIAFSETFGEPVGAYSSSILVSALRELGFDLVLDTNTGADLCVTEEGHELLERVLNDDGSNKYPLFTSCCPGWLNFAEKASPELVDNISTCKSPHMMYGAVIKHFSGELFGIDDPNDVYMCSIMPCVKKRGESDHAVFQFDGDVREVDNVITTKDLHAMLINQGVTDPLEQLDPNDSYDHPFLATPANSVTSGLGSGAGQLFGATGGVMEAAVRSVYELLTKEQLPRLELDEVRGLDGVKETTISICTDTVDKDLRVAVVNGLGNAKKLIAKIEASDEKLYDFVEVMACPGGCINGGGQPRTKDVQSRMDCVYSLDRKLPIRRSHENPVVKELYQRHLGGAYGSKEAHGILHIDPVYGGPNADDSE